MAQPMGSVCNLDCKYCFYLSKERLPNGPGTGEISDETLELFIKQHIQGETGSEVVFSWQGASFRPRQDPLSRKNRTGSSNTVSRKPSKTLDQNYQSDLA